MSAQPPSGPAGPVSPGYSGSFAPSPRLQEVHGRLQALLEALPDLLFVLDRDGRIYDYHAPVLDRLYVPPDQFLGRLMKEVLPEPAVGIVSWAIEDAVAHGFHRGSVYPLPTAAGERWFEISIAAQGDPQTPQGRLVAIVRDVTDRRAAEETLRHSEAQFRMLTEGMRDVAWVFDVESPRFTYVSPSVEALRGYTAEEIIARPFEEALVPAQRAEIATLLEQNTARFLRGEINENDFFTLQILQPCKDGTTVPSEAVCRFVRNEFNGRLELHGITRDMSARVRAEEAVRQSERRLRQIIDLVPHFIFAKDAEGRFILANKAIADAYGTTVDEILGKTDKQFDPSDEEVRHFREDDQAVMASGQPLVVPEETITDSHGHQRTLATVKIPFTTSDLASPAILGVAVDITDRKLAEDALRDSEARYRHTAQISRSYVWEVDADGVYTFIDPLVEDVLGYRPDEIVGRMHFYDFLPPGVREEYQQAAEELIRRGGPVHGFENPCLARDGRVVWVSSSAYPILGKDGSMQGYQGIDMDITDRKRAEEALRVSEQRFKEIAEQSRIVIWEMDASGLYTYVNEVCFDVLGYRPEEIVGKLHFYDFHPEEGREELKAAAFKTIQSRLRFENLENPVLAKDGSVRWVSTTAEPLVEADGRLRGYRGSGMDITHRRRAEEALRKSEERFDEIARQSRTIVWEMDAQGVCTYVSPAVEDVLGYRPAEVMGKLRFADMFDARRREEFQAAVMEVFQRKGDLLNFENLCQTKDGRSLWVSTNAHPILAADGSLLGYQGSVVDIDQRKRAEEALRESLDQMARAQEMAHMGSWELDLPREELVWSDEVYRIFGLAPQEFAGTYDAFLEYVHPEDRAAVDNAYWTSVRDGSVAYEINHRIVRQGTRDVRWVHEKCTHVRDARGKVIRSMGMVLDITERQQAEDALRESEARSRAIHNNLSDGLVYQIDSGVDGLERRFVLISQGVGRLHGVPAERVLADASLIYGQILEEDLPLLAALEARAAETLTPLRADVRVCLPSGEIRWRHFTSTPRRAENGHLVWDGIELDITERKRAEESLRMFKESVENASDAVGMSTPEGKHYYQNRAFDELFGAIGSDPPDTLYVDPAVGREVFRTVMAGGQWTGEVQMYARDRRILEILLRAYANKDENGRITALLGIHTDITERKRAEKALRESEERFEQSSRQSRTYLWEVDPAGLYTFVNPVVEDVLGFRPEELVGRRYFYDLMPDGQRESFKTEILEAIQQGLSFRDYESPCVAKDGQLVWLITSAIPMRNADGSLKGYRGSDTDITARKQAEEELRQSEQTYRMLTETMKDVIWVLDVEAQRFLYVSPSVQSLRGFTAEEILAMPLVESWAPEEREELMRTMQHFVGEFLAGRIGEDFYLTLEMLQPCKDGPPKPSEVVCHLVRNRQTGRIELHGVSRDVTERKQAEAALRRSEAKYRLLHESMRDAFVSVDMDGHILEANGAFQALTGYAVEELRHMTYRDLTPEKWHAHEARIVAEQVMLRGYSDVYQKEYLHKDGTHIPIEIRTTLIRDEAGHPAGMWATVRNITARLRVERALKQATSELERRVKERTADLEASKDALARSEEQFRQMTEIIQEVFWLLDARTGRVLYVSPTFEEIWRRPPSEFLSGAEAWLATLHPEDRDRVHQDLLRGLETGEFMPMEYRILRPDGSIRWIQDSAWAIRDAQGAILRVAGVFHDVTERRRLEMDILNAAELERQRIGRDLHDSLGQSLTGIGYLAEALREDLDRESRPEAAEAGKLAHLVVDAADRAHTMARGLLLADMKRGGLAPALHELSFRTQELFGVECRYEGLAEVDLTDLEVAGHLYRIAQEASTNAAKHGKGTGILIRLDQAPEGLKLSIQDTGPGMPAEPGTERRMGLDIMRYRAGLIGGNFWIDSPPGKGTTVNCVIPRSHLHTETPP